MSLYDKVKQKLSSGSGFDPYTSYGLGGRLEAKYRVEKIQGTSANWQHFGSFITLPVDSGGQISQSPTLKTLPFIMTNQFSFGLGNNWTTLFDFGGFEDIITQFTRAASLLSGDANIDLGANVSLKSRTLQSKVWTGSKTPQFSINCLFVSTDRNFNPLDAITALARGALGTTIESAPNSQKAQDFIKAIGETGYIVGSAAAKGVNTFLEEVDDIDPDKAGKNLQKFITETPIIAPLGYGLQLNNGRIKPLENTTVALTLGRYFAARDLVIDDLSNITFSKEIIAPPLEKTSLKIGDPMGRDITRNDWGFPLYATCTLTLSPYQPITFEDFVGYFPNLYRYN